MQEAKTALGGKPVVLASAGAKQLSMAYLWHGRVLRTRKKYEDAIKDFDESIKADPDNQNAYQMKAKCLLTLHLCEQAVAVCRTALRVDPRHMNCSHYMSMAYEELKQNQAAADALTHAIDLSAKSPTTKRDLEIWMRRRAQLYCRTYQKEKCLKDWDDLVKLDPNNAMNRIGRGKALVAFSEFKPAEQEFAHGLATDPKHRATYLVNLGCLEIIRGDLQDALKNLK
ncbi:MAG: tetratricopeptide repeat protein, partial [Terriglobales bacterium]